MADQNQAKGGSLAFYFPKKIWPKRGLSVDRSKWRTKTRPRKPPICTKRIEKMPHPKAEMQRRQITPPDVNRVTRKFVVGPTTNYPRGNTHETGGVLTF